MFDPHAESGNQPIRFEVQKNGYFKISTPAELTDTWCPQFERAGFDFGKGRDRVEPIKRFRVLGVNSASLAAQESLFSSFFKACLTGRIDDDGVNVAHRTIAVETSGEEQAVRSRGALFGTTEQNKKVEKAAIKFAKRWYRQGGWKVRSVERERVGFDLKCVKGPEEEQVEVKGVQGPGLSLVITAGEVRHLQEVPGGVVFIVNNTLTKPSPTRLSGREFLGRFELVPLSYNARPKAP
jgi:Domain of unknown function (DUF3883)